MHTILGQTGAMANLRAQLATGRVHHAQLFHGPLGVGKFSAALAFARVLLCHQPQGDAACGDCPSCRLMRASQAPVPAAPAKGRAQKPVAVDEEAEDGETGEHPLALLHPDLHVVVKELAAYSDDRNVRQRKLTQIPVEIVREHLLEPAHKSANLGHGKVLIVDEAELLNAAGQNAILKTLEEPPPGTTIILVSAREDRLLPTIRSRCQRVAFGPISEEEVAAILAAQAPGTDPKRLAWLARFAQGSPGRALLGLEYGLDEWGHAVLEPLRDIGAGKARPDWGAAIAARIDAFAAEKVQRHRNASKEAANRQGAELMFSTLAHAFGRRLRDGAAHGPAACSPWLTAVAAVREAEERLGQNANLGLVCEGLSSRVHSACGC